ncbi:hypothetical protein HHK36_000723 [Tetracentron sinense]|uniref:CCHC-type domain-containing protein n=1 Tax=Tetracentron sinense TaxID=13715 RepID=A0A835DQ95_TETSI|nr:hypothetical protein HHK36_000723 [Tetracentron sinense]
MDNALIDDRRIHVDFSQSVAKLWSQYRRKDNQAGKGCFKCGALDHIAKDCTGDPSTKQLPPKYVLKDENTQRGGDDNSRYEMVFDGDTKGSSRRDKRQRDSKPEDPIEKQKMYKRSSEDLKHRVHDKKDSTSDGHRHDDTSRGYREDERNHEMKATGHSGSRRDEEYHIRRASREKMMERHKERENHKRHNSSADRRDEHDYKKRSMDSDSHGDRKDERDYRKKSAVDGSRGDRREERDYGKRNTDTVREYDRYSDRRHREENRRG